MKDIESRTTVLNQEPQRKGSYVLYWMQASQRTLHNHALEYSIREANRKGVPVVVCFGAMEDYPQANERHFRFMFQGLEEVSGKLGSMGIRLVLRKGEPWKVAEELSEDACLVVCDRGYLRHQIEWRRELASSCGRRTVQIESDVLVPVEEAAEKEMYSAAPMRRRLDRSISSHLVEFQETEPKKSSLELDIPSMDASDIIDHMEIDRSVKGVDKFVGGTSRALIHMKEFMEKDLDRYHLERNDPSKGIQSDMSPYLHFGQISPLTIALLVGTSGSPGSDAYLDELVVRRELAINFVFYNDSYDSFLCLPEWSRKSLREHASDKREHIYSRRELDEAETHDPYWNAAQTEMVRTGKMHNYMRMYWGKKILEWTEDPEEAFDTAIHLNNRYELDGRDPNSYAGVAWCFGKHDRPWKERPVFGKVRYMNDNGLKRKFDIEAYVENVSKTED
ncbi:MAG: deoxyribodipyrimidine photo-lyase [Thermoplasmatota archaeon]